MKFRIYSLSLLFTILFVSNIFAQENSAQYCANAYEKDQSCPETVCRLGCSSGIDYEGCTPGCVPKSCVDIDSDHCPKDSCQLLKGCDNRTICYYKVEPTADTCGEVGYNGQDVPCCQGLEKRCGIEFFDGTCDMIGKDSIYAVPICLPCGNGICNQFEDSCNCPEDCKKK